MKSAFLPEWPHNFFGWFWLTDGDIRNALQTLEEKGLLKEPYDDAKESLRQSVPFLEDVTDPDWGYPNLLALVRYLEKTPESVCTTAPDMTCPLCGENLGNPSVQKTDGVWSWPGSLPHFVKEHDVRLPDSMMEHIEKKLALP